MPVLTPKDFKAAIVTFCKLLIVLFTSGAFLYVMFYFYPQADARIKSLLVFVFLYLSLFLLLSNIYRTFKFGTLRLKELLFAYYLTTFITDFIMYFILGLRAKGLVPVLPMSLLLVVQWIVGSLLYSLADKLYTYLYPSRLSIVVRSIGGTEGDIYAKLSRIRDRYTVGRVVSEADGFDAIVDAFNGYSTVFLGNVERTLRRRLTDYCFDHNKRLLMIPTVEDIIFHGAHETFIDDSPVYLLKNRNMSIEQQIIKRLMDIGLSLIGIVLTSPLMFLTAMIIKLQDGGPVFFRQLRYTRNMKTFTLLKFRSMVVDAEKDGAKFTVENDARITPFGKIIRSTRIDELPQFFNILRGEMSLVGPRAERVENVERYMAHLPEFRYRMKVKAGLTGYAQIFGKYNTTYEDKLKLDLLYIENCSIVRDLQLLFLTLSVIFTPESTEGYTVTTLDEMEARDKAHINAALSKGARGENAPADALESEQDSTSADDSGSEA